MSARLYRAAWTAAAVPVLVAAFTVTDPHPLELPRLDPSFDQTTAVSFATGLARRFPDRSPGSPGARRASRWVASRFRDVGLAPHRDAFRANLPGKRVVRLVNVFAVARGRSPDPILVIAHRDNSGRGPGANDNASGTAALLELARNVAISGSAHTFVFVSTDGGAYGAVGAERIAAHPEIVRERIGGRAFPIAVVSLDALAGHGRARLAFAGDAPRSPTPTLLATADASIRRELDAGAARPAPLAQLIDLAFPFTLHEQGPFVARGTPAVTLGTGGERPARADEDTLETFDADRLGELGRASQALLLAIDDAAELARGTQSYVTVGGRLVSGWTLQFLLLAALAPFLVCTVDLFARCRRRHVPLAPALRSLASRFLVWGWAGAAFVLFAALDVLPNAGSRPLEPDSPVARNWPVAALIGLALLSAVGWLEARPRLVRRHELARADDVAGHLAALLALSLVALVVVAVNPYALLFLLPSAHAWLWLADVAPARRNARLALFAAGLGGPALLLASFATRLGLGGDAPWYLLALTSVGYVAPPLVVASVAWAAIAAQVGALALGRYAPYPLRGEERGRGPIRAAIRGAVLAARRRRAARVRADAPHRAAGGGS